jgi:hypothetical protein
MVWRPRARPIAGLVAPGGVVAPHWEHLESLEISGYPANDPAGIFPNIAVGRIADLAGVVRLPRHEFVLPNSGGEHVDRVRDPAFFVHRINDVKLVLLMTIIGEEEAYRMKT